MLRIALISSLACLSGALSAVAAAEVNWGEDDRRDLRDPDYDRGDRHYFRRGRDRDYRPTPPSRDELAARLDQEVPGACLDAALGRHRASLRVRLAPGRRPLVVVRVLPASAPIERCLRAVGQTVGSSFDGRGLARSIAVRRSFDAVGARPEPPERERAPGPISD